MIIFDLDGTLANWDKDEPIQPVIEIFEKLSQNHKTEIWSERCESLRFKTEYWINQYITSFQWKSTRLKMRPIGDSTPDDELKQRWLEETYEETKWGRKTPIEFVFDDQPKVIRMWRRHGIFVFNCLQHDEEF